MTIQRTSTSALNMAQEHIQVAIDLINGVSNQPCGDMLKATVWALIGASDACAHLERTINND